MDDINYTVDADATIDLTGLDVLVNGLMIQASDVIGNAVNIEEVHATGSVELQGTSGNESLIINEAMLQTPIDSRTRVNAGEGIDTLIVQGDDVQVALGYFDEFNNADNLSGFDVINLDDILTQSVFIQGVESIAQLKDDFDGITELTIDGGAEDIVDLLNYSSEAWSNDGNTGTGYNMYTATDGALTATLFVDQDIQVFA